MVFRSIYRARSEMKATVGCDAGVRAANQRRRNFAQSQISQVLANVKKPSKKIKSSVPLPITDFKLSSFCQECEAKKHFFFY